MRSYGRLFFVSLSIADRVEVFSARSSLNYSWKRQIRRPFSVRAYGNGDKSDLTAVFFPIESVRSSNLHSPSLSHSLPSSLLFPLHFLIPFLILGSSYLTHRSFNFILLFALRTLQLEFIFTLSFLVPLSFNSVDRGTISISFIKLPLFFFSQY